MSAACAVALVNVCGFAPALPIFDGLLYDGASRDGPASPSPALTPTMDHSPMARAYITVAPDASGANGTYPCVRCGWFLPPEEFGKSSKATTGLQSWCKVCKARDARLKYVQAPRADATALPGERWKPVPIPEYGHLYEVSDTGRIRALPKSVAMKHGAFRNLPTTILKLRENGGGYLSVAFWWGGKNNRFLVHRLVAAAFHGEEPFQGALVRHLDGNRLNNIASNLAWGTPKDNADDRILHGRQSSGTAHHNASLKPETLRAAKAALSSGLSQSEVARRLGVGRAVIRSLSKGNSYKGEDE